MNSPAPLSLSLSLSLSLLAGCAPESEVDIVGDWFICLDPACTMLDRRGFRFEAAGAIIRLDAPREGWSPPGTYCADASPGGRSTYRWNSVTSELTIRAANGEESSTVFAVEPSGQTGYLTLPPQRWPVRRLTISDAYCSP